MYVIMFDKTTLNLLHTNRKECNVKLIVDANNLQGRISRHVYGQFSEHLGHCIYDGLYVGEKSKIPNIDGVRKDVIEALRNIRIPNLRWPGGCFADCYHWRDGIGPRSKRPCIVNDSWGGVTEDNSFGTHEFLRFCELIGAEPYINGNVSSGTVQEMSQWIEYLNAKVQGPMTELRRKNGRKEPWGVRFWGFGNEPWGDGHMRPEYYADQFRRYTTYARDYGDTKLVRIAAGANGGDLNWTEVLMQSAGQWLDAVTLHYYTVPGVWEHKGSATKFDVPEYYTTLEKADAIKNIIKAQSVIMDKYDPEGRVGLFVDEWGTWFDVEEGTNPGFLHQQNTMRDAMVAAISLNIFHRNNRRVRMANIAQLLNVLQAMILTEGEKMLLTPTYHVFDLYKVHQDADRVETFAQAAPIDGCKLEAVTHTASVKDGVLHVSAANIHAEKALPVELDVWGFDAANISGEILGNGDIHALNTFKKPNAVKPRKLDLAVRNGKILFELPPCSVATITLKPAAAKKAPAKKAAKKASK